MYCNDSVCRRGMKFCTGVGVRETNYATSGFPEIQGGTEVKRGECPRNWKLRIPAIVFATNWPKFTQIWRCIGAIEVHKTSPQSAPRPPKGGQNLPKRGNLCVTATVFIAQRLKFNRTCWSTVPPTVPLAPHKLSPNLNRYPFWGHKSPEKGEICAYADHCICSRLTKIFTNLEVHRSNNTRTPLARLAVDLLQTCRRQVWTAVDSLRQTVDLSTVCCGFVVDLASCWLRYLPWPINLTLINIAWIIYTIISVPLVRMLNSVDSLAPFLLLLHFELCPQKTIRYDRHQLKQPLSVTERY